MKISVSMKDVGVARALVDGEAAVRNLGSALDKIAGELLALSDKAFGFTSDPSTRAAWPELAPSTVKQRAKLGLSGAEILQRSGTLKASVQTEAGRDFVEIGSPIEYALIHQLGGSAGRGGSAKIPARPFVGASPDDLESFERIISEHIARATR